MVQQKHITGIILAGGKSTRMGSDKGVMKINGVSMVEHVIHALKPVVERIIIVSNNDNYAGLGFPVVRDVITDCGPMGGIYTGLLHSATSLNLVVSCDIPFVTKELLGAIASAPVQGDIVVPVMKGEVQPLCARYKRSCAERFAFLLDRGMHKMKDSFPSFSVIEIDTLTIPGFEPVQLTNINSKKELAQFNVSNV